MWRLWKRSENVLMYRWFSTPLLLSEGLVCSFPTGPGATAGADPGFKGSCTKRDTHSLGPRQGRGYPKKKHSSPRAGRAQTSPRGAGKQPAIMGRPQTPWKAALAWRRGRSGTGRTGRGRIGEGLGEQGQEGAGRG